MLPWTVSNRPLLAKTCLHCGWLLDAKFYKRQKMGWSADCAWCRRNADTKRASQRRAEGKPPFDFNEWIKGKTNWSTDRNGYAWTLSDHEIAADPTKTVIEKASLLHRSYRAVTVKCSNQGYRSLSHRYEEKTGQWQIKFNRGAA